MAFKHKPLTKDSQLREGIKAEELLELLSNHAFGLVDLSTARVKSIEILLHKCLPNIMAMQVDVSGGVKIEVLQVASHPVNKPAEKRKVKPAAKPGANVSQAAK